MAVRDVPGGSVMNLVGVVAGILVVGIIGWSALGSDDAPVDTETTDPASPAIDAGGGAAGLGDAYVNGNGTYFSTSGAPADALAWQRSEDLLFNRPLPADTPTADNSAEIVTRLDEVIRGERLYDYDSGIEDDINAPLTLLVDSEAEQFTEVRFRPQACGDDTWWAWSAEQFEPYINGAYADQGRTGIPVPPDFRMSPDDADSHLVVYDFRRDRLIELWYTKTSNLTGNPGIEACWGGIIDDFAASGSGLFPFPMGVFAAGTASPGLMVTLADVQQGEIRHAIAVSSDIAIDDDSPDSMSWPANRNDGHCRAEPTEEYDRQVTEAMDGVGHCLWEGQFLRLPADYDVASISHPYARMLATAIRDYGMVLVDKAGCFCIQAESSLTPTLNGLAEQDPWERLTGGTPDWELLAEIDWTRLQVLPKDWGRPSDYRIACSGPPGAGPEENPMAGDERCQQPVDVYASG